MSATMIDPRPIGRTWALLIFRLDVTLVNIMYGAFSFELAVPYVTLICPFRKLDVVTLFGAESFA